MSSKPPTIASSGIASSDEDSGATAGSSLGGSVMNPPSCLPTDPSDDLQQKVTPVSISRALIVKLETLCQARDALLSRSIPRDRNRRLTTFARPGGLLALQAHADLFPRSSIAAGR